MPTGQFRDPGVCKVVDEATINPDHMIFFATPPGIIDELMTGSNFCDYLISATGARLEKAADGLRVAPTALGEGLSGGGAQTIRVDMGGLAVGTPENSDYVMFLDVSAGGLRRTLRSSFLLGTDLSLVVLPTEIVLNSSTGADVAIPAATSTMAGLMLPADRDAIDAIIDLDAYSISGNLAASSAPAMPLSKNDFTTVAPTPGATVVGFQGTSGQLVTFSALAAVDLVSIPADDTVTISNIGGASGGTDAIILAATYTAAGVMTADDKSLLDTLAAAPAPNLGLIGGSDNIQITNPAGTGVTLLGATTGLAGLMTAADKTLLGVLEVETVDLSVVRTDSQVEIENSDGVGAILLAASITEAGVMSAADKIALNDLVGNPVALSVIRDDVSVTVENSLGDDAVLPLATNSLAGVMSAADKTLLSSLSAGSTNLTTSRTAATYTIINSTGTDATLLPATITEAGLLTADDKQVIDNWVGNPIALSTTRSATTVTVLNNLGDDALILEADGTFAGVMTSADKVLLDGLVANPTNLSIVRDDVSATIENSTGTDAVIPVVNATLAGLMSAADKVIFDGLVAGSTNLSTTRTATTVTVVNSAGDDAVIPVLDSELAGLMPAITSITPATTPPITATDFLWGFNTSGAIKAFPFDRQVVATGHGRTAADVGKPIVGLGAILNDATPTTFPTGILKRVVGANLIYALRGDVMSIPVALLQDGAAYSIAANGRFVFWDLSLGFYVHTKPGDSATHIPDLLEVLSVGATEFVARTRI